MHLAITNWISIPVNDWQRAGNFYAQVLRLPPAEHYAAAANVVYFPDPVNGGYCGSMTERADDMEELKSPLIYIYAYGDVDHVAEQIIASGGRVLSMKTDVYPEEGVFIIFEDTENNKLAFVGLRSSNAQKNRA